MAYLFRLEDEDGEPAEPPSFRTTVHVWRPGDSIPLAELDPPPALFPWEPR